MIGPVADPRYPNPPAVKLPGQREASWGPAKPDTNAKKWKHVVEVVQVSPHGSNPQTKVEFVVTHPPYRTAGQFHPPEKDQLELMNRDGIEELTAWQLDYMAHEVNSALGQMQSGIVGTTVPWVKQYAEQELHKSVQAVGSLQKHLDRQIAEKVEQATQGLLEKVKEQQAEILALKERVKELEEHGA